LEISELPAQLDTAADRTVLPWHVVEDLQLMQHRDQQIEGFGGTVTLVPVFLISLSIHEYEPIHISALADKNEPHTLLGRDVLNQFDVSLKGPKMTLEIA
jgi:predicted aspartyl protease